jgi:hypothetical protein
VGWLHSRFSQFKLPFLPNAMEESSGIPLVIPTKTNAGTRIILLAKAQGTFKESVWVIRVRRRLYWPPLTRSAQIAKLAEGVEYVFVNVVRFPRVLGAIDIASDQIIQPLFVDGHTSTATTPLMSRYTMPTAAPSNASAQTAMPTYMNPKTQFHVSLENITCSPRR